MKYRVICSTGELNISVAFDSYSKARAFSLGLKKGYQLWDMEFELDISNYTHRGFRFGQILAYYYERHYLSNTALRSFVEVVEDEELD
jgi:hypothetical protein